MNRDAGGRNPKQKPLQQPPPEAEPPDRDEAAAQHARRRHRHGKPSGRAGGAMWIGVGRFERDRVLSIAISGCEEHRFFRFCAGHDTP